MKLVPGNPNVICEDEFVINNYQCVINFIRLGHRCGYILIPADNPVSTWDDEDIENGLMCHGGITYIEKELNGEKAPEGAVWIGFDCGHSNDIPDYDTAKKYFPDDSQIEHLKEYQEAFRMIGEIRTHDYCVGELGRLALQLDRYEMLKRVEED